MNIFIRSSREPRKGQTSPMGSRTPGKKHWFRQINYYQTKIYSVVFIPSGSFRKKNLPVKFFGRSRME